MPYDIISICIHILFPNKIIFGLYKDVQDSWVAISNCQVCIPFKRQKETQS